MTAYFLDSSALAKCYINEVGSSWVRGITAPSAGNDVHVFELVAVEVVSTMARRRKGGSLTPAAATTSIARLSRDLQHDYVLLKVSDSLILEALVLADRHELRAYDALHLAAAMELSRLRTSAGQSAPIIVSADLELNAAAVASGFAVEDPNSHP